MIVSTAYTPSFGRLDAQGRCCGRKPLLYKGGSWNSPKGAPVLYCFRCDREFDPVTHEQRENWAHKKCQGCGCWIAGNSHICGECSCEVETP